MNDLDADVQLARLLAMRLLEAGLIQPERFDEVTSKIAQGAATAEDWRLWIELSPAATAQQEGSARD